MEDRYVLVIITICLVFATLYLLYLGFNGHNVPTIINLPVSIACGIAISQWFN